MPKSEIQHYNDEEARAAAQWRDAVTKLPHVKLVELVLSADDILMECLNGEDTPTQKRIDSWLDELQKGAS